MAVLPLEALHFTCIFFHMNNKKFWFLLYTSLYAELFDKNDIVCSRHTTTMKSNKGTQQYPLQ
jgi:hypothetical protein